MEGSKMAVKSKQLSSNVHFKTFIFVLVFCGQLCGRGLCVSWAFWGSDSFFLRYFGYFLGDEVVLATELCLCVICKSDNVLI